MAGVGAMASVLHDAGLNADGGPVDPRARAGRLGKRGSLAQVNLENRKRSSPSVSIAVLLLDGQKLGHPGASRVRPPDEGANRSTKEKEQ